MRIEDIVKLLNLRILNKGKSFKVNAGFTFVYIKNKKNFIFDTRKVKKFIEGVPVTHLEVIGVLKKYIRDGLRSVENKTKGGNFYVKSRRPKNS